jgi:alkylhydroperoxidase/carboxymuconolactone decarboxylase family protein YurZ
MTKELIAVAVAHVTQCPTASTGIPGRLAARGPSPEEIMEAIWMAAEMRAGGAYAHATLALQAMGAASSDDNALSEASTSHLPATWRSP